MSKTRPARPLRALPPIDPSSPGPARSSPCSRARLVDRPDHAKCRELARRVDRHRIACRAPCSARCLRSRRLCRAATMRPRRSSATTRFFRTARSRRCARPPSRSPSRREPLGSGVGRERGQRRRPCRRSSASRICTAARPARARHRRSARPARGARSAAAASATAHRPASPANSTRSIGWPPRIAP